MALTDPASPLPPSRPDYEAVCTDVVRLVQAAREGAARSVNAWMTATYWLIGRRIVESDQGGKRRAAYGSGLLKRLSEELSRRFGRGFGMVNLQQMRQFYLAWPPKQIDQTLSDQFKRQGGPRETAAELSDLARAFPLPWSAYVRLLSVRSQRARRFYEREALRCGWSVRQLARQINSQFYERALLSRNKAGMLKGATVAETDDLVTAEEAIKDPFVLEFLGLKDEYSESKLEEALIQHLADFLLELGDDFAFIGRQRRLRIDDNWFRVDLVFFHRRLKCLVIIDLKIGRFGYADAGQMHLYLNYAREHWMKPGENPPVGLILCAAKGEAEAHYALSGLGNTVVAAEYRTVLPEERLLADKMAQTQRELESMRRPASTSGEFDAATRG
ncbi:YhcG family protein [Cupriavidus sp. UGS-1]|uniref:PDDEXK nuclease domain-containing protein n=1 Tax=Cupriavidus sp. UGS-1 TaxID=2899826 RepID=UPI001E4FB032|nr:PDDEXK nuclease domain-containing protein [Cupriavidus sp. UGS-1]MCD9120225.1 PDDEXK nuclease domain-containing protein [Cupriavidus sp. UGS-1]